MFRITHNPEGSKPGAKLALAAATAVLAFALVLNAAGTSALQTETASSVGIVQILRQKAESVYASAQTFVNVLRVARSGAEALKEETSANPSPDSLLKALESDVQHCSDSPSQKPAAPATTQS